MESLAFIAVGPPLVYVPDMIIYSEAKIVNNPKKGMRIKQKT